MRSMWNVNEAEGTATGPEYPVIVGDRTIAILAALWSDEEGVTVHLGWATDDALSGDEARALAAALTQLADLPVPQ